MGKFAGLWLLLVICITVTAFITVAASSQQQYIEDDDDFRDFDGDTDFAEAADLDDSGFLKDDGFVEDDVEEGFVEDVADDNDEGVPVKKLVMADHNQDDDDDAAVENDDGDEFSHLSDEEEFIGYTAENMGGSSSSSRARHDRKDGGGKEPKITVANVPLHLRSNWDSFYLELMLLAGLLIYFTNFSIGRSKNARMAAAWFEAHKTLLLQQFALVGDDGKGVADNGQAISSSSSSSSSTATSGMIGLQKESESMYSLYCSGRSCVNSMMVELRFIKRQDLVSLVTQIFRPSTDEVLINLRLDDMDTFVLCLAAKKCANNYVKEMTDIQNYCPSDRKTTLPSKQYGSGSNSSKFVVWSEITEASNAVLADQRTVAVLAKNFGRLNYLHISDQYSGPHQPDQDQQMVATGPNGVKMPEVHKVIILSFNLMANTGKNSAKSATVSTAGEKSSVGSTEDMEGLRPMMLLLMHLADKLYRMRLSKESKLKADRNRSRVQEYFLKATHAARAERAQEKREEKKREEREKIMEIDDPEKQRKWEERENRRAAKKKVPKMKQLKVT
uniref:PAT complex subunit CCDC47 n=2 Tax=Hirondellea gigas TaxID=1518452 RepID=A0A2P2HZN9_9CRUS